MEYKCLVCGYVYDWEMGDPDFDVAPETPFYNIPDSWLCPVCGAEKSQFKAEEI
ncbi:MAG: rubredoxin [Candidatus Omnitrophota bacterium]